ncbi:MAG: flavin reductase family protein [Promethearchaeia archaeon]
MLYPGPSVPHFIGVYNIAPYGMVMPVSYHPLIISIGSDENRDTFRNIIKMKEFVLNVPSIELLREVNQTADPIPADHDEFEHADLTPIDALEVKPPRIQECRAHLECRLLWKKQASTRSESRYILTGEVVSLSLDEELYRKNLCMQKGLMKPLFYERHSYFSLGGYVGDRRMR